MIDSTAGLRAERDPSAAERIVRYVRWHLIVIIGAICWLCVLAYRFPPRAGWLTILLALALLSVALAAAWVLARYRRIAAAVTAVVVFNWVTVVAAAALAPFALTIEPITALLPTLLAAPYLRRSQFAALLGANATAVAVLALVGTLSPGVGVEDVVPRWVLDGSTLLFVPAAASLAVFLAWQSHHVMVLRGDELTASRRRLTTAAARQRQQIEQALNAGPGRGVAAALHQVEQLSRLAVTQRLAVGRELAALATDLQDISVRLRDMAHGIFPAELAERGVAAGLQTLLITTDVPVEVTIPQLPRFMPDVEAALYFCCEQAIDNVRMHAGAGARATVDIDISGPELVLTVTDTGIGCDPAVLWSGPGIAAMNDRMLAIGGSLDVYARRGSGVRVRGIVPRGELVSSWTRTRSPIDRLLSGFLGIWVVLRGLVGGTEPRGQNQHVAQGIRALVVTVVGTATVVAVAFPLSGDMRLLEVGGVGVATTALLCGAALAERRGHRDTALVVVTLSSWGFALVVTLLAPAALPYTSIIVAVPVVLAIPHLPDVFGRITAGTAAIVVVTAAIARFAGSEVDLEPIRPAALPTVLGLIIAATVFMYVVSLGHAALTERAEQLRLSRFRVVVAADTERWRIERDLHDGAQQRLVSAAIQARVAERRILTTPEPAAAVLASLVDELEAAAAELQDLCRGIYPAELAEHGVEAALRSLAARSPLRTLIHSRGVGRHPPEIEVTVYFCCLESVQNCIKHAGSAATVTITLREGPSSVVFEVSDDGPGTEPQTLRTGHGFTGMTDRLAAVGGSLEATSAPGAGVVIRGRLPLTTG